MQFFYTFINISFHIIITFRNISFIYLLAIHQFGILIVSILQYEFTLVIPYLHICTRTYISYSGIVFYKLFVWLSSTYTCTQTNAHSRFAVAGTHAPKCLLVLQIYIFFNYCTCTSTPKGKMRLSSFLPFSIM